MAGASALTAWLLLEVAAYATLPGVARVEERNTFYVAPLFVIALLLWVQLGAPRPRLIAVGLGGRRGSPRRDAAVPAADPAGDHVGHARVRAVVEAAGARARAARRAARGDAVRARRGRVVPARAATLGACAAAARARVLLASCSSRCRRARSSRRATRAPRASADGWTGSTDAVRGDDVVGVLWAGRTDPHVVWENEFFNRSVGPVYDVGRADARATSRRRRCASEPAASCESQPRGATASQRRDARPARREASRPTREAGVSVWASARPVRAVTTRDRPVPGRQLVGPRRRLSPQRVRAAARSRVDAARRPEPVPTSRRRCARTARPASSFPGVRPA